MLFHQLRSFYITVKQGSLTKAANSLYLTQSAITHQLKALEERLGCKLYERHPRGIRATPIGTALMKHCYEIMRQLKDMEEEITALKGQQSKLVTIACHRGIATYMLPGVIQQFRAHYPHCNLEIRIRFIDDEILEMVSLGDVDMGIATNWNNFKKYKLEFYPFEVYEMMMCVGKNYTPRSETFDVNNISLASLAGEPLLLYEPKTAFYKRITETFRSNYLDCQIALSTGGAANLLKYAGIGIGVAIISSLCLTEENPDKVNIVPVSHLFGELPYGIILRKDKFLNKALLDFITILDPDLIIDGKLTCEGFDDGT